MFADSFSPDFLLGRIADTLHDIAGSVPDPYERRQVRAAADVLRRVARSVEWNATEAAEDQQRLAALRNLLLGADPDLDDGAAAPVRDRRALLTELEQAIPKAVADPSGVAFGEVLARLNEMNRAELGRAAVGDYYREVD